MRSKLVAPSPQVIKPAASLSVVQETLKELSDIGKIEADSEYSEDVKKSGMTEEKIDDAEKSSEKEKSNKENN